MRERKWTPGPWFVVYGHRSGLARGVNPVLRFDSLMRQRHDASANAWLIAAAPDMAEALIEIADKAHDEFCRSCVGAGPCNCHVGIAEKVLAKAYGEHDE